MNEPSVDLQRFIDARDAGEGKAAMIADAVCEKYKLLHRIIFHPDEPTFPFTDEEMPYLIIAMMLLEEETRRVFYEAANEADRMIENITCHLITEKEDKMNYKNCECNKEDKMNYENCEGNKEDKMNYENCEGNKEDKMNYENCEGNKEDKMNYENCEGNKEDKMNYENCEGNKDDMTPEMGHEADRKTSMTEKIQKIKGIATDVGAIADRLHVHMFGKPCLSGEKRNKKEPTCLDDDIENIMRIILEAYDVLNETCNKIGC